ncbi:hypothetical protein [Dialister invisus]|uniref:hypothetical protein n=1 Tax=Dialister invisus TaxID=218538 RepID=UPI0023F820F9|nr:hypothetical protein [Dialister invisus]
MVRDKKIALLRLEQGYGSGKATIEKARTTVWGKVGRAYSQTVASFSAIGINIEKTVDVERKVFESAEYTHAEISGKTYGIASVLATDFGQSVTLLLKRG